MSFGQQTEPWQQLPGTARRLVAEVCRKRFHPAISGYLFRKYCIMANASKPCDWETFKTLKELPPQEGMQSVPVTSVSWKKISGGTIPGPGAGTLAAAGDRGRLRRRRAYGRGA